jgi:hypothetical protein
LREIYRESERERKGDIYEKRERKRGKLRVLKRETAFKRCKKKEKAHKERSLKK